ncbi:peptide/nickel transport system ATP-binding protein [Nakamurella sp. UYEF19]|uniref:ABC transporter ATP-binding protein n=1 Tax=Nakamurella sp. UYEF19 TaxID=1756392 RepID=UPI003398F5AC
MNTSTTPPSLLDVQDLRVHIRTERGTVTVVQGVALTVQANEVLCIVGESGSGKSVTMLSVMRLLDEKAVTYEGSIKFQGRELLDLPARQMRAVRGAGIAMIFQDPMTALNPVYRVGWQIAEQLRAHRNLSRRQARTETLRLLTAVGIGDPGRRIDNYPHELSGGLRQRVMIALALSCRPKILIADEPTTALDVTVQSQILQLIFDLRADTGMAVVLVTHDMGVVAEIADRVQVMYGGNVVEHGTTTDIFNDPHHPYTAGLLASIPRLDQPRPARLPSIAGTPASAGNIAPGCVFAARCPHRFDACSTQPELRTVGDAGHQVACHLDLTVADHRAVPVGDATGTEGTDLL